MMIKPWYLAPLLAAAALVASAYWWQAEKDRWVPPKERRPDLPKVEPMPQSVPMRARQALERPVLWVSRRPLDVDDKKGSVARELTQSRLTAVLESGGERVAILQRADGSTLKITAATQPWRIVSFDRIAGRGTITSGVGTLSFDASVARVIGIGERHRLAVQNDLARRGLDHA